MPPLPNVANVVKLNLLLVGSDGRKAENVFHWGYTGGVPTAANVLSFASHLWNTWVSNMIPETSSTLALTSIECTDLSSSTGNQATYTNSGTPVDGSLAGGVLPLSSAMLLNKYISRLYRGGHPRSYLAVGDTTKLADDGHFTTAFQGAVGTAWAAIITAMNGYAPGGVSLTTEVCVSYIDKALNPVHPYWRAVPAVFPINSYGTQAMLATQRRRVRRTARHR